MPKTIIDINDDLYRYMLDISLREAPELKALREHTANLEMSLMQVSSDQGQFMSFLVSLMGAQNIIEVGTFTGYSALAMALATADDARIICCDINEQWTDIAQQYWKRAGVQHKIDLRLAPALDTLNEIFQQYGENHFDFVFIDADKENYDAYYEIAYRLVRDNGVIAIDNVFWGGSVIDMDNKDSSTIAIRELNQKLHSDERVAISLVPIGDGLTLARKLTS